MARFKKRSSGTKTEIPVVALPDIVFILLIFFMVTTVLRSVDLKVRVRFTNAKNVEKITQKRLISYIYVGPKKLPNGQLGATQIQIDDAIIDNVDEVRPIMHEKYQAQPKLIVSLRVDRDAESGIVLDIQEQLRKAEARRINYSTQHKVENQ